MVHSDQDQGLRAAGVDQRVRFACSFVVVGPVRAGAKDTPGCRTGRSRSGAWRLQSGLKWFGGGGALCALLRHVLAVALRRVSGAQQLPWVAATAPADHPWRQRCSGHPPLLHASRRLPPCNPRPPQQSGGLECNRSLELNGQTCIAGCVHSRRQRAERSVLIAGLRLHSSTRCATRRVRCNANR